MPTLENSPTVVVTGANGLVGARTCAHLLERGATVRAVVRREGTAPDGTEELVGDFTDSSVAARAVSGATAVVSTVHPMGSDRATQESVGVDGTVTLARAARDAHVETFVHVSTAAVYDRTAGVGDVDEHGTLVGVDAGDYPVTKRDLDAALGEIGGITRVLVRPPAVLGSGESSVWNTLRPASIRAGEQARAIAEGTFAWVHVDDLAAMLADLATGRIARTADPEQGPVLAQCTPVNVAGEPATQRDYYDTIAKALEVRPVWQDEPGWTGQLVVDRARRWGWQPEVDLATALAEINDDVSSLR